MRLDRDNNGSISSLELLTFLRDNREFSISEEECSLVVNFYDADHDGRLTFPEFQQLVLPCEDNFLRREVQDRYAFRVSKYDKLPANHEFSLCECLAEEIRLLRRIESLKADLTSRYDYTNYACFRTLDIINDSYIKPNDMREFYRNSY